MDKLESPAHGLLVKLVPCIVAPRFSGGFFIAPYPSTFALDKHPMAYWLVKQEPDAYSFEQFRKDKKTDWTGVRNFAARLHLLAMQKGDWVLYYHSNIGKEIVGLAKVSKPAFPDPTATEGNWVAVELAALQPLTEPVTLEAIKKVPALKDFPLVRIPRLSVMPVTEAEFSTLLKLGKTALPA